MTRMRTWAAHFRHTSARYLPRPVSFTLHAYLVRGGVANRELVVELDRVQAEKVREALDHFLWRTDPAGVWAEYPDGWRSCVCGYPVLDGHLTCGRVECAESVRRNQVRR
jgi:hypothetical protein